jgi:hypothetical protein
MGAVGKSGVYTVIFEFKLHVLAFLHIVPLLYACFLVIAEGVIRQDMRGSSANYSVCRWWTC